MKMLKALSLTALAIVGFVNASSALASEYRIGAQDKLRIKVYEWPALSDEVVVSAEGFISLPIVGSIKAAGSTTSDLASQVASLLHQRASLSELPHTSIEVSQFRPFYILGEVQRPGEYPYRPGMSVLMALSIAGGRYRPPETTYRLERDAIQSRSSLATAASKRRELRVRLARLRAELGGKDAIELERIPGEADYPPELIRQERSILQARLSALQNQVAGLRRQIELSTEEVWSLKARLESSAKQQISVAKELSSLKGLSEKGILLAPRQTTLERLSAQIEGDQRDIDARIAQVRQTMAQAEASISRLIDERNREVGLELRSTSGQLEELDQHIALHRSLIAEAEALGGLTRLFEGGTRAVRLEYRVTRVEPDGPREFPAQGNDPVEPGDLITVDQFIGDGTLASESASSAPVGGIARRTQ